MAAEEDQLSQAALASEFEDFKVLGDLQSMDRRELFDEQFMHFIRWFKKDIFSRYTKAEFRRMERNNFLSLIFGYLAVLATYILCPLLCRLIPSLGCAALCRGGVGHEVRGRDSYARPLTAKPDRRVAV